MEIRENWRILVLVVLLVVSGFTLLVPSGDASADGAANETAPGGDFTNLEYGLELSGGTRLRAELVGLTAEEVGVTADNVGEIEQTVADELGIDPIDVTARRVTESTGTVEVFENVTAPAFADALGAAGLDVSTDQIREGVTDQTLTEAQRVLDERINRGGLTGGGASIVRSATGSSFVVVEVPNANRSEVLDLVGSPGRVQVVAEYPVESANGTSYQRTEVLQGDDIAGIGPARQGEGNNPPYVQVTLNDEPARQFAQAMNDNGFTSGQGIGNCRWRETPDDPGWCLYTVVDGEITYAASMGDLLADDIRPGGDGEITFLNNPTFRMQTGNFSSAVNLNINLNTGALPTELDIQSELFLAPSLAQKFKPLALATGLVAWLVVSGVVFYRYREARVAIPMLATAAAEVFILLGFAAAVGLALDLSHIAGFIAVIGTGVDDLVIIADEILQRGDIKTGRVFKNRFRKAFWVIGAAAATTIIAMSPLTFLGLGDLSGFAIVTIVGVLIGVLVTRPAYGDVLRNLLLEDV